MPYVGGTSSAPADSRNLRPHTDNLERGCRFSRERAMSLSEMMIEAWRQSLVEGRPEVEIAGRKYTVTRTRSQGLRVVSFLYQDRLIEGIEQNPEKASRWAKLAQEGKRIMQFRIDRRYIGNVCEGQLLRYPAWKGQGLPD